MSDRNALPSIVERTSRGEYLMDPYSKLLSERVVFLGTTVDDAAANDVVGQLLYLDHDRPERDIALYLNTPGGSASAIMIVYDTLRFLTNDVRTVCLGQVASFAAVLLAAGTPGKRMMLPHARVVLRQPEMAASQGPASDLEIQARELLRTRTVMEEILVRHTGQSAERIRRDIDRETILTGPDALAYGLVDRLLPVRDERPAG